MAHTVHRHVIRSVGGDQVLSDIGDLGDLHALHAKGIGSGGQGCGATHGVIVGRTRAAR